MERINKDLRVVESWLGFDGGGYGELGYTVRLEKREIKKNISPNGRCFESVNWVPVKEFETVAEALEYASTITTKNEENNEPTEEQ